jgi:hypothetical protein
MRCEVSDNLMILDQNWIAPLSEEPAADWSDVVASVYKSDPHGCKTGCS